MRPIPHPRDEAMLERIDPAIFDMARIIGLVADQVLPETPLPDAALVARDTNFAAPLLFRQGLREAGLDQPPARREVTVGRRQRRRRVQVIGQDDEWVEVEV